MTNIETFKKINHEPCEFSSVSAEDKDNEELALCAIRKVPWLVRSLSDRLLQDNDFLLRMSTYQPECLDFAMNSRKKRFDDDSFIDLRDDKEYMMRAIKLNGNCFRYASEALKNDFELAFEAVKHSGYAVRWVGEELMNDVVILRRAYRQNPRSIRFASSKIRDDRNALLTIIGGNEDRLSEAVQLITQGLEEQYKLLLEWNSKKIDNYFRFEYEYYLKAIAIDTSHIFSVHPSFFDLYPEKVYEFMEDFVNQRFPARTKRLLALLPERFKDDRQLVEMAVSAYGDSLQNASLRLRNDRDLVFKAVTSMGSSYKYASDRLRYDRQLLLLALEKEKGTLYSRDCIINFVPKSLLDDKDIIMAAIRHYGPMLATLQFASDRLQDDYDVVKTAVTVNAHSLKYASSRLRDDMGLVECANWGMGIRYASDRLKDDREFAFKQVLRNGGNYQYISKRLQDDEEILLEVLKVYPSAFLNASERLRSMKEIAMAVPYNHSLLKNALPDSLKSDPDVKALWKL